jgi:hypothetical protein
VPDERLAAAVAELYGAAPAVFTERRVELAAAARSAGDGAAAKAIGALRRPTRTAWLVNRLARTDPSAPPKLANLAAELRAAQRAGDGPRLRELSAARGALIDALTAQALAGVPDPPPSLHAEVAQTLAAALADPEVAAAFAAGTLTKAAQWSGFGVLPANTGDAAGENNVDAGGTTVFGTSGPAAVKGRNRDPVMDSRSSRGEQGRGGRDPGDGGHHARRNAVEAERLAREAADRADRRREQYEDAERTVAATSTAATEAVSAEDRLEAEVHDLEQRLIQARDDLAAARLRARQAEASERRARQALDRLPGE